MTALLKFIITSILGLVGFTTSADKEIVKENYAPHAQEIAELTIVKPMIKCDNNSVNTYFLLK